MSLRSLNWRTCQTHGHTLHSDTQCVCCHEIQANTSPAPRVRRSPPRTGRFGTLGRPRSYAITTSERAIALALAKGATQSQVAVQLGVTRSAVSSSVRRSLDRIGASNTQELKRYVMGLA